MAAHLPAAASSTRHLTGYYSFTYGAGGGIEGAENDLLSGSSDKLFYRRVVRHPHRQGASPAPAIELDHQRQGAGRRRQGARQPARRGRRPRPHDRRDPRAGQPPDSTTRDRLCSHDTDKVVAAWKQLNADPTQPMVDRAIAGNLYPPGSTFKIVTAAAALESGKFTEESQIPGPAVLDLPADDRRPAQRLQGRLRPQQQDHAAPTPSRSPATPPSAGSGMQVGADDFRRPGGQVRDGRPPAGADAGHAELGARPSSTSRSSPSRPSASTTCASRRCRSR